MDLKTTYLGLELANPIVSGSCPLGANLDTVRLLEDAGAAAVVMPSLFEEEIMAAATAQMEMESAGAGFAEASSYIPNPEGYHIGPDHYLEHVQGAKEAVSIPIIASINGTSAGGWTRYAKKMEEAGADALELNTYYIATDANEPGSDVEKRTLDIVTAVKEAVSIPIAVKLSPFFSSLANFAKQLQEKGADGLVIFNRFYQPDLDIEELDVVPNLRLSTADELRLRLRWLAILSSQVELSLAATGGAHNAVDVIKATMAGAHSVQMVSALLIHGPEHIKRTLEAVDFWLTEHEYESLRQMQGSMNMSKVPDAAKLTRANYMKMLDSWQQ
ncbi:MAG: dihydroorotate dehydrogenase-like protein [Acidobacteria bacterium]|uniref:Dihydroorotate dehydrogenase-like protein n=1 Tax=Candidatus Sulfomarinibacter kjeldsenii TaxID=2885994 RepID=A0A8J6XZZ6_9BACT|nr:dihydroorotate dehydrogenase-like protein [Candidatus Sulfomarinibacter kjeldsenii]